MTHKSHTDLTDLTDDKHPIDDDISRAVRLEPEYERAKRIVEKESAIPSLFVYHVRNQPVTV